MPTINSISAMSHAFEMLLRANGFDLDGSDGEKPAGQLAHELVQVIRSDEPVRTHLDGPGCCAPLEEVEWPPTLAGASLACRMERMEAEIASLRHGLTGHTHFLKTHAAIRRHPVHGSGRSTEMPEVPR